MIVIDNEWMLFLLQATDAWCFSEDSAQQQKPKPNHMPRPDWKRIMALSAASETACSAAAGLGAAFTRLLATYALKTLLLLKVVNALTSASETGSLL